MSGFLQPANGSGSGGSGTAIGRLGPRLTYSSPAGGAVAAAPANFLTTTGRLIVSLPSGNATWVSLTAGADGQLLVVENADAVNTLTLSAAGFLTSGLILPPGHRGLIFYDSTDVSWEIANA